MVEKKIVCSCTSETSDRIMRWYVKTKEGTYMSEAEAFKAINRLAITGAVEK
jgi:hypothetical protein